MKKSEKSSEIKKLSSTARVKNATALSSTSINLRERDSNKWVMAIREDLEKLLRERITRSSKNNYWMLYQVKSELNLLSNMLHQNENNAHCSMEDKAPHQNKNARKLSTLSSNTGKQGKITTKQMNTSKSHLFTKGKTVTDQCKKLNRVNESNTIVSDKHFKSQNEPTPPTEHSPINKSQLGIHQCFNFGVNGSTESETNVVSKSVTVEQLKSFWNDRMKTKEQVIASNTNRSEEKIVEGLELAFEFRKNLMEDLISKSSLYSMQSNCSKGIPKLNCSTEVLFKEGNDSKRNLQNGSEASFQTFSSGCPLVFRRRERICQNGNSSKNTCNCDENRTILKNQETICYNENENTKSIFSIKSILKSLEKISSELKSLKGGFCNTPIYSQNINLPSEIKQKLIDLVNIVNDEESLQFCASCLNGRNNSIECEGKNIDVEIKTNNPELSSDAMFEKPLTLLEKCNERDAKNLTQKGKNTSEPQEQKKSKTSLDKSIQSDSQIKITINVTKDSNNPTVVRIDTEDLGKTKEDKEIGIALKFSSVNHAKIKDLGVNSEDTALLEECSVVNSDKDLISCSEINSNELNYLDSSDSSKQLNVSSQVTDTKNHKSEALDRPSSTNDMYENYFGWGDSFIDDKPSQSSSLRVNVSSITYQYDSGVESNTLINLDDIELNEATIREAGSNTEINESEIVDDYERSVQRVTACHDLCLNRNQMESNQNELKVTEPNSLVSSAMEIFNDVGTLNTNTVTERCVKQLQGESTIEINESTVVNDFKRSVQRVAACHDLCLNRNTMKSDQDELKVTGQNYIVLTAMDINNDAERFNADTETEKFVKQLEEMLNIEGKIICNEKERSLIGSINPMKVQNLMALQGNDPIFKEMIITVLLCNLNRIDKALVTSLQEELLANNDSGSTLHASGTGSLPLAFTEPAVLYFQIKQVALNYRNKIINLIARFTHSCTNTDRGLLRESQWTDIIQLCIFYFTRLKLYGMTLLTNHFAFSLIVLFLIEEELFGFFGHSKRVNPF